MEANAETGLPEGVACINLLISLGISGSVWYPKTSPCTAVQEGQQCQSNPTLSFWSTKFPWEEKSLDEWFPVQVILQDQLGGSFLKTKSLGLQTYWSFLKAPPRDSGAQILHLSSTCASASSCGCQCVSRIHHVSRTKTHSNLSKNPFSSTIHNGSYHEGGLDSLTQKLTAF